MTRIALFIAAAAATLCLNALPSPAASAYGNAPWCAVRSLGTEDSAT